MKNIIFNFHTLPFLPILLFFALLMTACQKENLQELTKTNEETQPTNQLFLENSIQVNVKDAFRRNRQAASARSATYLILDTIITIEEFERTTLVFPYDELPDPIEGKIQVQLIPVRGNPDMALIAEDNQDLGDGWHEVVGQRTFRRNPQLGLTEEVLTFRQSDLFHYEELAIVQVLAEGAAEFQLVISGVTLDCEEYAPADTTITQEYAPVCGCNGQEYSNKSEAFINGITSWTEGGCIEIIVVDEDDEMAGEWELEDAKLKYFDVDIHKIIIDELAGKIRILNPCALYDCDRDWKDLVRNPKTEKYEVIYKLKTETRYFQIELIKEGLLRVEMYRDFHGKTKNTTTVYHFKRS